MNIQYETLIYRLESLGLNFMAAGLESFLWVILPKNKTTG
jgi:hypothetical protein